MKNIKIVVDVLMLLAVILSFIRWSGSPTLHAIAGIVCSLLFVVHFWLNRKAFIAYGKAGKKLSQKTKTKYLVDLLLLAIWSIAIISSIPALGVYVGVMESSFHFGRMHGVLARIGGGLIVIHAIQHSKQIKSYLVKRA